MTPNVETSTIPQTEKKNIQTKHDRIFFERTDFEFRSQ